MDTSQTPIRLAVLGDSIADGQGASRRSDTLAARLVDGLTAHGFRTDLGVFAVRRARSTGLRPQVDNALAWEPDVVVLVIGANDLAQVVPVPRALGAFREALQRLRGSGAKVVVAPAPDLSAVPHVPVRLRPVVEGRCRQ